MDTFTIDLDAYAYDLADAAAQRYVLLLRAMGLRVDFEPVVGDPWRSVIVTNGGLVGIAGWN